jgi:acetyltransferase-like isoleucine patch superfamily enzyme
MTAKKAHAKTGYDKMRAGELYPNPDWDLIALQAKAAEGLAAYNALPSHDMERRGGMLGELLGSFGRSILMSPVRWEYGKHIHIGESVFINFDCVFLDGADVRIGDGSVIAPRVQFLTAGHPVEPERRTWFDESGARIGGWAINKPITIGKDCWIGAGAIILGGVSIGDGSTIGAGSVVTRDVPPGVVAAGNPCRVIREIRPSAANAA